VAPTAFNGMKINLTFNTVVLMGAVRIFFHITYSLFLFLRKTNKLVAHILWIVFIVTCRPPVMPAHYNYELCKYISQVASC